LPGLIAWDRIVVGDRRETWRCWSVSLWEPVLVKVVRPGCDRRRATRALRREVRALRDLRHPLFPRLIVDGIRAPLPHLVMEYFEGPALDELVDDVGRLSPTDVACLGVDLLGALRHLHASGTAHLDICPDNVIYADKRGRLVDLGAARPLGAVVAPGEEFGSDGYIAPELGSWAGGPVTVAMDMYSLGATMRAVLDPDRDVDGAIRTVIDRLTDDDPGRRPPPDAALRLLVRHAGNRQTRPWPGWADRHLAARAGQGGRPHSAPAGQAPGREGDPRGRR
jgi:serine/threonine protein kinase